MKRYLVSACTILATLLVSLAASSATAFGAARGSDTVLIVPARPAVLQLAFDLANMRDITLVSFRGKADTAEPLIHVWNGNDWQYVPFNDFGAMTFIEKTPRTAIVIGDDQTVPKALIQNMSWPRASRGWPCPIERLQTLNAADLLNGMNPYFDFSSREWKRLAKAYGLQLEDFNAAKRSFNPYNIPRSKTPLATHEFKQKKGDTPPAVLIEKQESPPAKPPEKASEKPWIK